MITSHVVLDTNVVLDLLLFAEPGAAPLGEALARGQLRALACDRMLDELGTVLRRGLAQARGADTDAVVSRWAGQVERVAAPAPGWALRCTDGDDQVFIDLALERQARWLVTRDRAVLRLARRAARQHRLAIVTPEAWALQWTLAAGDRPAASVSG